MPDRKANLRTALILLSVALVFFFGIIAKRWLFPG
ncbi:MAG: cytochrome oxidase small assembly protein [Quisquiliibacterium sp.]